MNNETKLIFFNLDGTLIDGMEYVYEHLWEYFNIDKEKTKAALKQYLNKEISYADWVKRDVGLLQETGATRQAILDAIMSIHPMQGAVGTIRALQERDYKVIAISGGIDLIVEAVYGKEDGNLFQEVFINTYQFGQDGKLVGVTPAKYDINSKAQCVKDMVQQYMADPKNCVYVGNNENDTEAALNIGTSIAFNSKSERLVEVATHHVESKDIFDILKFIS